MKELSDAFVAAVLPHVGTIVGAFVALVIAGLGWLRRRFQVKLARDVAIEVEQESIHTGDRGAKKMEKAVHKFDGRASFLTRPMVRKASDLIETQVPVAQKSVFPRPDDETPTGR